MVRRRADGRAKGQMDMILGYDARARLTLWPYTTSTHVLSISFNFHLLINIFAPKSIF